MSRRADSGVCSGFSNSDRTVRSVATRNSETAMLVIVRNVRRRFLRRFVRSRLKYFMLSLPLRRRPYSKVNLIQAGPGAKRISGERRETADERQKFGDKNRIAGWVRAT
jgi:hypothetical protein